MQTAEEHLSMAREALAREQLAEAREALERAASLTTDEPTRLRWELAALELRARTDGPDVVLEPLRELGDRARGCPPVFALIVLERGAQLRLLGRYVDAAHHGRGMVELARKLGDPDLEAAAWLSLGEALRRAGLLIEARRSLDAGLSALAPEGEPLVLDDRDATLFGLAELRPRRRLWVALLLALGGVLVELGEAEVTRECLDALSALPLDERERAQVGLLGLELAARGRLPAAMEREAWLTRLDVVGGSAARIDQLCRWAQRAPSEEALSLLDRAAAEAQAEGANAGGQVRVQVALACASALLADGRLDEARRALPEEGATAGGLRVLRALAAAAIELQSGHPSRAVAPALEAAERAAAMGDEAQRAAAHELLATAFRLVGAVREAKAHRELAAELLLRCGRTDGLPALDVERAWTALIEGQHQEAEQNLAALDTRLAAQPQPLPDWAVSAALCRAALDAHRGQPEPALDRLLTLHERLAPSPAAASLAFAAQRLAAQLGRALPERIQRALAWAAGRDLPPSDPLLVPPAVESSAN